MEGFNDFSLLLFWQQYAGSRYPDRWFASHNASIVIWKGTSKLTWGAHGTVIFVVY